MQASTGVTTPDEAHPGLCTGGPNLDAASSAAEMAPTAEAAAAHAEAHPVEVPAEVRLGRAATSRAAVIAEAVVCMAP